MPVFNGLLTQAGKAMNWLGVLFCLKFSTWFSRIWTTLGYSSFALYCTLQHAELIFRDKAPNQSFAIMYNRY